MYNTPEFQALKREYLQGAMERTGHLAAQANSLRQGSPVDLMALRQEIHKLRGSGGFYGFADLTGAAARAEETILLVLGGELERNDQQIAALVDQVVAKVTEAAAQLGI